MTRILGIDPGSRLTGFGIVELKAGRAQWIDSGCIRTEGDNLPQRLQMIFQGITEIISLYHPEEVAIENIFMHRNADSALKLGQARGAAISSVVMQNLPVFEYTPTQIKQAVVGRGHAAKEQVQHMMKVLLRLDQTPQADAADALAVAICHGHTRTGLGQLKSALSRRRSRSRTSEV